MNKKKRTPRKALKTPESKKIRSYDRNPTDDISKAVAEGKLGDLLKNEILDSEHAKKLASIIMGKQEIMKAKLAESGDASLDTPPDEEVPSSEKKVLEELIKIAKANDVSLDWLVLRALRLYVQGYKKTEKL